MSAISISYQDALSLPANKQLSKILDGIFQHIELGSGYDKELILIDKKTMQLLNRIRKGVEEGHGKETWRSLSQEEQRMATGIFQLTYTRKRYSENKIPATHMDILHYALGINFRYTNEVMTELVDAIKSGVFIVPEEALGLAKVFAKEWISSQCVPHKIGIEIVDAPGGFTLFTTVPKFKNLARNRTEKIAHDFFYQSYVKTYPINEVILVEQEAWQNLRR